MQTIDQTAEKILDVKFGKITRNYSRGDYFSTKGLRFVYDDEMTKLHGIRNKDGKASAFWVEIPNTLILRVAYTMVDLHHLLNKSTGYSAFIVVKYDKISLWKRWKFFRKGFSIINNSVGRMLMFYNDEKHQAFLDSVKKIDPDYSDIRVSLLYKYHKS